MKLLSQKVSFFDDFRNYLKSLFIKSSPYSHVKGEDEKSINSAGDLDDSMKEQLLKFYVEGNPLNLVDRDELFCQAAHFVVITQSCSVSAIQREFSIGLSHAKLILDQIESAGIISPFLTNEGRKVLIKDDVSLNNLIQSLPHVEINNCIENLDAFYEKYKEEIEARRNDYDRLQFEEMKKSEAELLKLTKLEKILKKRLPETAVTGEK